MLKSQYELQDDWYYSSPEVLHEAQLLGIEDTVNTLRYMAKYSAPVTDPRGNRRFEDFLLTVKGRHIVAIQIFIHR